MVWNVQKWGKKYVIYVWCYFLSICHFGEFLHLPPEFHYTPGVFTTAKHAHTSQRT